MNQSNQLNKRADPSYPFGYTMDEAARIDLAPWGYTPGTGSFYCDTCQAEPYPTGNWPHRGHKHSTRCIEHAIEARLREIRCNEGAPIHLELPKVVFTPKQISAATVSLSALILTIAVALFASL